jgi:hypothetical protein
MPHRAILGHDRGATRHRLRAACQVVRERDFKLVGSRMIDLSDGGALVAADETVRPGETVIVSLRPPRTANWVDALGVVTRIVAGRRSGDVGPAFGVTLAPVDRASREALRVALHRLPEVQAARMRRVEPSSFAISSRFGRG